MLIITKVEDSLFGNNNNKNTGGNLFGNNTNQNNSLFSNNTNTNNTSLFGNNTSNNNQGNSLFGNNTSGNSLFGNNNNNSNQGNSLFGNSNNNQSGGSLFGNNNANKGTNSLFGNGNNGSLFGNNVNNTNNNTGGIFGNINTNNGNNGLFSQNNNQGNTLFGNNNANQNNQNQNLFGNIMNQGNNNMNNANITNNGINNAAQYGNITLNDIINPLEYISKSRAIKPSPQEEILANSISEAIQKKKTIDQFLNDLDKKYRNETTVEDTDDILDNYGTYLGNRHDYNYHNKYEKEIQTWYQPAKVNNLYKTYSNVKYRNMNINNSYDETNNNYYNNEQLSNSMSKINDIYKEYERNKNKFKNDTFNNSIRFNKKMNYIHPFQNSNGNININSLRSNNSIQSNLLHKSNNKNISNKIIGKDNALYHQNILELTKLSSNDVKINKGQEYNNHNEESSEEEDNDEILVMNNNNENENENINENIKINGITPIDINSPKTVELIIKYRLPDNESSGNMNILKIDNVNQLIKIQTLRNEIKSKINNELKLKGLENIFAIEKISLFIPGGFLLDTKSLQDYDLANCDYTIQAFITYSSISKKDKKNKENLKDKNSNKNNNKENELVPFELLPKLTKEGYKCSPSILELSRKSADELRKISGFKIFNKYGEVEFKEPVNLLGLNLDNQITIEKNLIDTGDKLNYWSKFTLFNFKVEENGLNKYKIDLEKSGGNFLEYKNNEIVWEYKKDSLKN